MWNHFLPWLTLVSQCPTQPQPLWFLVGFIGQLLFGSRFLVQWIVSERLKKSVIPISFWYLSIGGGLILLTYALYRRDPVFILGESTGCVVYLRNLHLLKKEFTK